MNNLIQNKELNQESLIVHKHLEKTINDISIFISNDNDHEKDCSKLLITFHDKTKIEFWDDGQSCCEKRYMHSDDDLKYYIGSYFRGFEVKQGPTEGTKDEGDLKECDFLEIFTSLGSFVIANYNEHNGYYSGFAIKIKEI